jgi:aminopeptidase N
VSRPVGSKAAGIASTLLVALGTATALAAAGSPGGGDPFFPRAGNGGYGVRAYEVSLRLEPLRRRITALARIDARAHQRLSRFNLDLGAMDVVRVRVGGRPASFRHRAGELVIVPRAPIPAGSRFGVGVRYRGRPRPMQDPDGSLEGWFATSDGAYVVGEPLGTRTWVPVNNLLSDKARWTFRITVPRRLKAVANGRLRRVTRGRGVRTWTWRERSPMAPYLATVNIGRGRLTKRRAGGVPSWTFVDPREATAARPALARLPAIMRFLERHFGPYPFGSTGAIVDRARQVGYALETQTRPVYHRAPDVSLVVHELAHQWYGNSVTPRTWSQIWLNEGFATWAEWFWSELHGGPSARRIFERFMAEPASRRALWDPPPGRIERARQLFAESVYTRGAMTLQALRMEVGTATFLRILRRWADEHRYGNVTTEEFIAHSESVSGRQLDALFDRWLFQPGKPG